jgi:hypothetical protein
MLKSGSFALTGVDQGMVEAFALFPLRNSKEPMYAASSRSAATGLDFQLLVKAFVISIWMHLSDVIILAWPFLR